MKKAAVYHKLSWVFLVLTILTFILCLISTGLIIKSNWGYRDCNKLSQGTLSSCVTEKKGTQTLYFGIYKFSYNNATWNYINSDYYKDIDDVPQTILIKHNDFKSQKDMKAIIKSSRSGSIPVIYGAIAFFCLLLYLMYHSQYKNQLLIEQTKAASKVIDPDDTI